ncbi:MAG: S24 family peptidase [Pseudomonadota bacterium]
MADDWKTRITEGLEQRRLNMKQASLAAGKGETFVRDMLKRDRVPSVENLEAVARVIGVGLEELWYGEKRPTVPVRYRVGAGSEVFAEDVVLERVEAPAGAPFGVEAALVVGDSMWPAYKDSDLIFFIPGQYEIIDLIGREVIAELETGQTYVKVLQAGTNGLWTLLSFNSPPITDVAIRSIAPVRWIEKR